MKTVSELVVSVTQLINVFVTQLINVLHVKNLTNINTLSINDRCTYITLYKTLTHN